MYVYLWTHTHTHTRQSADVCGVMINYVDSSFIALPEVLLCKGQGDMASSQAELFCGFFHIFFYFLLDCSLVTSRNLFPQLVTNVNISGSPWAIGLTKGLCCSLATVTHGGSKKPLSIVFAPDLNVSDVLTTQHKVSNHVFPVLCTWYNL